MSDKRVESGELRDEELEAVAGGGATLYQAAINGNSLEVAQQESITVVGGRTRSLVQRGIIIVGG